MDPISPERPRILLIEDNPGDARLFEELLAESNYKVDLRWNSDLSAGLRALEEEPPHVVVTDLGLPDSEGPETVRRLVEAAPDLPVVVLTGQQTMELAMASLDAGATEYLRKDELMPGLVARTLRTAVERKRVEAELRKQKTALRQSRERYRSLFRDSSDAILVHDLEGRIQEANPKAKSLFGFNAEELRSRSVLDLRASDEAETVLDRRGDLQTGDSFRAVSRFERADGSVFWGELSANATQMGEETMVRTMIRDITERKEAEQQLRENRDQLALQARILDEVGQAVIATDAEGNVSYWNAAAERIFGWNEEEVLGRNVMDLTVPDEAQGVASDIMASIAERNTWSGEFNAQRKDGSTFPAIVTNAPILNDEGELESIIGVTIDITEQKQVEQALREERNRLENLFDGIPAPVIHGTFHGNRLTIRSVNTAFEEVFGHCSEEVEGEDLYELLVPDDEREKAAEIDRQALKEGLVQREVRRFSSAGLRVFQLRVSRAREGESPETYAIYTDITEQKQRERQLEERDRQLQQIRENVTEVVWMSSPEKKEMEFISEAYEDIWGRSTQDLKERPTSFVEAIHPDDRDRVLAALEIQNEDPEAYEETYRVVRPGGEIRWVHDRAAGVYDENGGLERIVGVATDITQQRKREQALQDRQQKIESLYTATNDLLTAERPETVATRIHALLRDIFNYSLTGVDLERDGRLVAVEGTHTEDLQKPSLEPRPVEGESMAVRAYRDGETVLVENVATLDNEIDYGNLESGASVPFGDHGVVNVGQVERSDFDPFDLRLIEILSAHAATVLDRLEREEDLREERDLLNRILETSPVAIVRFNREGDFVQASGRAEEVLGLEKEEITDRTYNDPEWSITTPDGEPIPNDELPFARVISTEEPVYNVEHAIAWPNGNRRLLSVSGAPLTTAAGELEGAVFHLDDVTERRAAERALRESEQRFRGVFENAAIGIALLDHEGELLEVNSALAGMIGYDPDELEGRHFGDVTHPDHLDVGQRRFEELVSGARDQYQMEKRYVRKDGEVFWGRLTVSRHDETDEEQIIGMVEDIDEQKHYEQNLRAAKEEAEEASRLKSAMLANMSHEIRTPLTAVTGFSELLGEKLTGQSKEFADKIYQSGQRLMKTLDSVLRLSKLEAGAYDLDRELVALCDVVEDTAEMLRLGAEENSIALAVDVPNQPVEGNWNEDALNRIVENLVENAIKFTPAEGQVTLQVWEGEGEAVLQVEDSGIGIEEESLSQIFEAFKQESEGRAREYEGSGLGLSIVKELTEALGGTVDVESEKGKGTRFTVRLPQGN